MAIRNILNYNDEIIGQLELPDDTPEEVWEQKLAVYRVSPEQALNLRPITARQIRLQIVLAGLSLAQIDAALDQLPSPDKELAKIEWEYANEFEYSNSLVQQVAAMLGLSSNDLALFWQQAMQL